MKRILALFPLIFISTITFAQQFTTFCNAGLVPDGYVDFSAMPTAPNFPNGGGTSAPITVTLPVTGVAGLTVQVIIPALQSATGGPIYTVSEGNLSIGGVSANNDAIFGLQFSSPVTGVGLVALALARGATFSLQTDDSSGTPHVFQNAVSNFTLGPNFFGLPLQQVSLERWLHHSIRDRCEWPWRQQPSLTYGFKVRALTPLP